MIIFFYVRGDGSGLWGSACKASAIEKENCALRCLSPTCYESIYGADPVSHPWPCSTATPNTFFKLYKCKITPLSSITGCPHYVLYDLLTLMSESPCCESFVYYLDVANGQYCVSPAAGRGRSWLAQRTILQNLHSTVTFFADRPFANACGSPSVFLC
jgi:hypothetical protein